MEGLSKTPDEIKKGLKQCSSGLAACSCECPYHEDGTCNSDAFSVEKDALAYIQQLESTISQVSKALCGKENATAEEIIAAFDQVKRERDAAVEACGKFPCKSCAESENGDNCNWCAVVNGHRTGYVWRGVEEEEK
jgi:hypothetical protein